MGRRLAILCIAIGATLWGVIGLFVTNLNEFGFSSIQIVAVRVIAAALFLIIYVMIKNRKLLKIKVVDSKYFVGTGIISIVFFNWCLFSAIEQTSISIATILLYTAPVFVAILARIAFNELFTIRKVIALIMTLIGCALVVGALTGTTESISVVGIILGVGSGFFYALYSIFGKFALKKYNSLTITVYTFVFAAVAVTPFSGLNNIISLFAKVEVWINIVGLGFFSTMLAFILYTAGLNKVESSQASIIATIEPVVACLTSFFVFNETLSYWQYLGIFLVLTALIVVQESAKKHKATPHVRESAM